jgi:hypothetical protein
MIDTFLKYFNDIVSIVLIIWYAMGTVGYPGQ